MLRSRHVPQDVVVAAQREVGEGTSQCTVLCSRRSILRHSVDVKGGRDMTKNMGTADRVIRAVLAVLIIVLYFTGQITGTAAVILGIVAVAFLATSAIGWCPLYMPFKLSTRKKA